MSLDGVDFLSFLIFSDTECLGSDKSTKEPDDNGGKYERQCFWPIMSAAECIILRDRIRGVNCSNEDCAYNHRNKQTETLEDDEHVFVE